MEACPIIRSKLNRKELKKKLKCYYEFYFKNNYNKVILFFKISLCFCFAFRPYQIGTSPFGLGNSAFRVAFFVSE
jgi:hypothetical protein